MLQHQIEGACFADVFAGSGAMGLEALSRGASHVFLLESHTRAVNVIKDNITALGCEDKTTILKGDVKRMIRLLPPCDIIFFDPPYGSEADDLLLLNKLPQDILAPDGIIIYETVHAFTGDALLHLKVKESRTFGDTVINILIP